MGEAFVTTKEPTALKNGSCRHHPGMTLSCHERKFAYGRREGVNWPTSNCQEKFFLSVDAEKVFNRVLLDYAVCGQFCKLWDSEIACATILCPCAPTLGKSKGGIGPHIKRI